MNARKDFLPKKSNDPGGDCYWEGEHPKKSFKNSIFFSVFLLLHVSHVLIDFFRDLFEGETANGRGFFGPVKAQDPGRCRLK